MAEYKAQEDNDSDEEMQRNAKRLRLSLRQPLCEGAIPFLFTVTSCVSLTIILPILFLTTTTSHALAITAYILFSLGFVYFLFSIRHLFSLPPPPAPFNYPLSKPVFISAPKRVCIFLNPVGGKQRGRMIHDNLLIPKLKAANIDYSTVETQYSGHAEVLARELDLTGIDTIVAIGGDGTFHECVNGLMTRDPAQIQHIKLAVIPAGSGNSFLSDFGVQNDPEFVIDTMIRGETARIDVGRVRYGPKPRHHTRYSINVVYYSPDQCSTALNAEYWRWLLGTLRYDICAFWGLMKLRSANMKIECDGHTWRTNTVFLTANMTQHFGKGSRAVPLAKIDDGHLDMVCMTGPRGRLLRLFLLIPRGSHFVENLDFFTQAKEAVIHMPTPQGLFGIDGETLAYVEPRITVSVVPSAIAVYLPSLHSLQSRMGLPTRL